MWSAIALVALISTGTLFLMVQRIDALGTRIDADPNGQPSNNAQGDDTDSDGDDDDGVRVVVSFGVGSTGRIEVIASRSGVLNAFIDFDRDGVWETGAERPIVNQTVAAGTQFMEENLQVKLPPEVDAASIEATRTIR